MVTIDDVIRFVEKEYAWILIREPANDKECKVYESVMTILSTLDYAQLLEDKFGSLEQALDAEAVVHCKECVRWKSDKQYCDRPCMGKMFCPPEYYCGAGLTREWVERAVDRVNEIGNVNSISPAELKAALERSKDSLDVPNEDLEDLNG